VFTPRANLRAATDRVPGGLRPFDMGVQAHGRIAQRINLVRLYSLFA
jgi:hypothetical protein